MIRKLLISMLSMLSILTLMIYALTARNSLQCGQIHPVVYTASASGTPVAIQEGWRIRMVWGRPDMITSPGVTFGGGALLCITSTFRQSGIGWIVQSWGQFELVRTGSNVALPILIVGFPLWLPLILFSAYPVIAFFRGPLGRHLRRRRGA